MYLNQYVITTRFVIYDNSEIIRIIHEENGDWQFLGRETNLEESDAVIISLGEMMDFDNTLGIVESLPLGKQALSGIVESLPLGKQALRTNKMSPWYICDIDNINE